MFSKQKRIKSRLLSTSERRLRWGILGFSGFCLMTLVINSQRDLPLFFCPLKSLTHIPCPFCGITRSLIYLMQGNYHQSLLFHLFGVIVFIGLWGTVACLTIELITGKYLNLFWVHLLQNKPIHQIVLFTFISYYGLRLYALYGWGDFHEFLMGSSLGNRLLSGVYLL